jgi:hypothetical protein
MTREAGASRDAGAENNKGRHAWRTMTNLIGMTGPSSRWPASLWKMRMKGKDAIARAAYVAATLRRVVAVNVLDKKTEQKVVLGAIAVCVAMALYPPMVLHANGNAFSVGYHFLWSGPRLNDSSGPVLSQVDFGRLVLQWVVVAAVAGGWIYWLRTRDS